MKIARIGCMVLGIALLMFVIAPVASAQISGEWFKGSVSLKGYVVDDINSDVEGKDSGKGTVYVNIVGGTGEYTVTACLEDRDTDNVWNLGDPSIISTGDIFTDPSNKYQIWDFFNDSVMNFPGPALIYPMFKVTFNKPLPAATTASFKSFACAGYDVTSGPLYSLGSCSISFKNIDAAKVPRGTTGCIITGP